MSPSLDSRLLRILRDRAPRAVHAGELLSRLDLPRDCFDDVVVALGRLCEQGMANEMPGRRFRFVRDTPPPKPSQAPRPATRSREEREPAARTPFRERNKSETREPAARTPFRERNKSETREPARPSFRERGRAPAEPAPRAPFSAPIRPERGYVSLVRGVLSLHPRGFGFVAADDGGLDVHVPITEIGPALHGDRVEVEAQPSSRGREGRVVGIVERRRARLVGSIHADFGRGQVFMPGDPRLPETMRILDALPADVAVGDAVVAEIRQYPQSRDDSAGVVVLERLGVPGDLRVEVERILARDGVVEAFSESVLGEAKQVPKRVLPSELEGRRDLREVPLATIDPDDARDHDDALYAERLADGGYRIFIAIADVSHYVRPNTAIDAEALARCTSLYLPDRAIPMLPREISSKMASLLPGEDRLCMGVEVELAPNGLVRERSFFEGVMRSRARLTYGGAARALGLTKEGRKQKEAEALLGSLEALLAASRALRARREKRGSIDFDLPESRIVLGADGTPTDVVESRRDPGVREAYRLVEEMMLLANELVAEHLTTLGLPGIHRIHPAPEEKRIELFCQLAQSLGHDLDPESAMNPRVLSRFLERTKDAPEAPFLRFLLLRAMQQASYSLDSEVGHFGLGARHYLHFTSPIRRYPDLAVHRVLRAHLRREAIDRAALLPRLRMQAAESSRLERRAMTVERDVRTVHEITVMKDRIGEVYEGSISSVEADQLTVRLDAPFVDVLLELERFARGRYELDGLGLRLTSRTGHSFGVGDRLRVRIVEASLSMRRVLGVPETSADEADEAPRRKERPARSSKRGKSPAPARVDPKKARRKRPRER